MVRKAVFKKPWRNIAKTLVGILIATGLISVNAAAQPVVKPVLWGNLVPGEHQVGFKVEVFQDESRRGSKEFPKGRPVEIAVWYPSKRYSASQLILFEDYVKRLKSLGPVETDVELRRWLSTGVSGSKDGLDDEKLKAILGARMYAHSPGERLAARFPLILWTTRHDTIAAQSVISEYLASHGYVVAVARFGGKRMPYPWEIKTASGKKHAFSDHLADLTFALKKLQHAAFVDSSKVTIMNWSYGAEFSPALQMNNPDVGLVIGLSSNPLSPFGLYQGNDAGANLKVDRLNVPYVYMTERIGTNGAERKAPGILGDTSSGSYFLQFRDLAHGNFNVIEGMIPGVFGLSKVQGWSKGGKLAQTGYEAVFEYSLFYLDKIIKNQSDDRGRSLRRKYPEDFLLIVPLGKRH